jgi:hypothetical protein
MHETYSSVKLDYQNNFDLDKVNSVSDIEPADNISDDSGSNLQLTSFPLASPVNRQAFPHRGFKVDRNELTPLTIENLTYLLDQYNITVRYNLVKKSPEIIVPDLVVTPENAQAIAMSHIKSRVVLNGMSPSMVDDFILAIADKNQYNPVEQWIGGKEWDGIDRVPDICNTITAKEGFDPDFKNLLIERWLLSAVAAVYKCDFRCRGVLTFQGAQGIGKTTWIKNLVNHPILSDNVIKIDHLLDVTNKDSVIGGIRFWITEIGELDASFRRDYVKLKGFITSSNDVVRVPYARTESSFPRRTVFAASVNEENFLVDKTGNNRFWTIPVVKIDYQHSIDMQQVFAQLKQQLDQGSEWWLTPEEEAKLNLYNESFQAVDVVKDLILECFCPKHDGKPDGFMSASDVLGFIRFRNVNNQASKDAGRVLRTLYGEPRRSSGKSGWDVYFTENGKNILSFS